MKKRLLLALGLLVVGLGGCALTVINLKDCPITTKGSLFGSLLPAKLFYTPTPTVPAPRDKK